MKNRINKSGKNRFLSIIFVIIFFLIISITLIIIFKSNKEIDFSNPSNLELICSKLLKSEFDYHNEDCSEALFHANYNETIPLLKNYNHKVIAVPSLYSPGTVILDPNLDFRTEDQPDYDENFNYYLHQEYDYYTKQAVTQKNPNLCSKIKISFFSTKCKCTSRDFSHNTCVEASDYCKRSQCYISVLREIGKGNLCDKIEDLEVRNYCYSLPADDLYYEP